MVSTLSGSLTHRKMPPFGSSNSAAVPNCSFSVSISVSTLARSALRSAGTCVVKCGAEYSASTIYSSAPEPASVLSARMRAMIALGGREREHGSHDRRRRQDEADAQHGRDEFRERAAMDHVGVLAYRIERRR